MCWTVPYVPYSVLTCRGCVVLIGVDCGSGSSQAAPTLFLSQSLLLWELVSSSARVSTLFQGTGCVCILTCLGGWRYCSVAEVEGTEPRAHTPVEFQGLVSNSIAESQLERFSILHQSFAVILMDGPASSSTAVLLRPRDNALSDPSTLPNSRSHSTLTFSRICLTKTAASSSSNSFRWPRPNYTNDAFRPVGMADRAYGDCLEEALVRDSEEDGVGAL